MQIDLNDDQLELLVNVVSDAHGDVEFECSENELNGYASTALYQAQCRLKDLFETIKEQSGSNWAHNVSTQRMEPRYKLREG
jgi:hypothetical protein